MAPKRMKVNRNTSQRMTLRSISNEEKEDSSNSLKKRKKEGPHTSTYDGKRIKSNTCEKKNAQISNLVDSDKKKYSSRKKVQHKLKVIPTENVAKAEENLMLLSEKDIYSKDLFDQILKSKQKIVITNVIQENTSLGQPMWKKSLNVVRYLYEESSGMRCSFNLKQSKSQPVVNLIQDLSLYRVAAPFDRRCTALDWHPTNNNLLAVGSKAGDIILWNIHNINQDIFIQGRGPGGSISAMKFHPKDQNKLYTASLDGKVSLQDLHGKHSEVLLDTMTWDYWYCAMDFEASIDVIVAGESTGKLTLLSMKDGKKVWTHKLHKEKITHTEFSPREPWLLCSSSVDKTCKLWDVRMIKDKNSFLCSLQHDRPVNSAYFSQTDGTRLLTTDQHNDLRVYTAPHFMLERTISHPHRFFQHITPIKASWHPLQDFIVVGRYPDKNFPGWTEREGRTIDVFNADTGNMVAQINDSNAPGIISLNKFQKFGDTLASTMGVNILIWRQNEDIHEKQERLLDAINKSEFGPGKSRGISNTSKPSTLQKHGKAKQKQKKENISAKMKLSMKVKNTMKK